MKRGWYSSIQLIELFIEGLFSVFILYYAEGYLFYSVAITLGLFGLCYLGSVIWEIASAKEVFEAVSVRRILYPWLAILIIAGASVIMFRIK